MSDSLKFTLTSSIKLPSGHSIPRIALGVYQSRGDECSNAVKEAVKAGYIHVDSAQAYRNEELVGNSISAKERPNIFITTKIMPTRETPKTSSEVLERLRPSLAKLNASAPNPEKGYIDLMLIHAPFGGPEGRAKNWEALKAAQDEGWIRDIGVSNFGVRHLKELPGPKPAVNQIEIHPWCQQKEIVAYCEEQGIAIEAYCPLVQADPKRLNDKTIVSIAKKHNKESAHVLIRWGLQKGFITLPKSVTPSRIRSNIDVYDFELDAEDMKKIEGLDLGAKGAISWNPVNDP